MLVADSALGMLAHMDGLRCPLLPPCQTSPDAATLLVDELDVLALRVTKQTPQRHFALAISAMSLVLLIAALIASSLIRRKLDSTVGFIDSLCSVSHPGIPH